MCVCFNAGKPDSAPMNVRIPDQGITYESFVVYWDAVMDIFTIEYTVRWHGEDDKRGTATVNGLSYTVTTLTANTSYNVTVAAINTCCGAGPTSDVIMIMTRQTEASTSVIGNVMYIMHAGYVRYRFNATSHLHTSVSDTTHECEWYYSQA